MRNANLHRSKSRRGFTLVELLVATALTLLIMSILAATFQTAIDSLGYLRAAGELQDRLRTASDRLKQDLIAPHFEDDTISGGRLSNIRFDQNPSIVPQSGLFRIEQDTLSFDENITSVASPSIYSSMSTTHRLLFTSKLPGKSRQGVFTAPFCNPPAGFTGLDHTNDNMVQDPTQFYASRWAIVSWFLVASGDKTQGSNPAQQQPLYNLYRRNFILAEAPGALIDTTNSAVSNYAYVPQASPANSGAVLTPSQVTALGVALNTPLSSSLAAPGVGLIPNAYTPTGDGSDILLSNVLSFEVKADYTPVLASNAPYVTMFPRPADNGAKLSALGYTTITPASVDTTASNTYSSVLNQDYPFDYLPRVAPGIRAFDTGLTGGSGVGGQNYRVRALQIKIRVYDPKTRSTRQVTLIQDM